ncbi:hypothetical protein FOZ62_008031 [Perkinsus olseni]|uniref:Uncharacterized protein n=1 Tax=Perkinsus olseni TaxID=32597 RepID=A0A7J6R379_PEROL|nr:hypothetical protein FOZ62_008031 [Perkinsus olseni]
MRASFLPCLLLYSIRSVNASNPPRKAFARMLGHIPVSKSPDCFRFSTKCVGPDFARLLYLQSNKPPGGDPSVIFCINGLELLVGIGAVRVWRKWQASTHGFRTILGASTSSGSDDNRWRTVPPPLPKRKERPRDFVADVSSKGTRKKKRKDVRSNGVHLVTQGSDQNLNPSTETLNSEASFLPSSVVASSRHGTVGSVLVALMSSTLPDGEYVVVNTELDLLRSVLAEIETVPPTDYRWVRLSFDVNGAPVTLETIALSFDGCLELDFSDEFNSLALLLLQSALEVREILPESFRLLREPGDGWSLVFHVNPDTSGTVVEIRAPLLVSSADAGQ